jgi:glucose-1-phosphatase
VIKAIIFDFGNVICTFDNGLFLTRISKYTDKSVEELDCLIYKESDLPRSYETGHLTSDEFFQKIVILCGLDIPKEVFIEAYTEIFSPIGPTFELIKKLKKNYRLALLSNTSEWDFNYGIKPVEIFDLFDAVSLSFEVKAMKPSHKIFDDCINKLHLKPSECIYIDDIKKYSDKATELGMIGINYTSHAELLASLKSYNIRF